MAMNAAGVSGSSLATSTGASLIAPRRAIGRPSSLSSSIAGSSSGSSARAKRRGDDQPQQGDEQQRAEARRSPSASSAGGFGGCRRLGAASARRRGAARTGRADSSTLRAAALPDAVIVAISSLSGAPIAPTALVSKTVAAQYPVVAEPRFAAKPQRRCRCPAPRRACLIAARWPRPSLLAGCERPDRRSRSRSRSSAPTPKLGDTVAGAAVARRRAGAARTSRRDWSGSTPAARSSPGLAERWNVSDDGLSYIFRLPPANGPTAARSRRRRRRADPQPAARAPASTQPAQGHARRGRAKSSR